MLVQDKEMKMGHTKIQHGKYSDRVYVMDYKYALDPYLINQIQLLAKDFDYGKIIAKIPKAARPKFTRNNFETEAMIPDFYNGKKSCFFMAKYNKENREEVNNKEEIITILNKLESYDDDDRLNELEHEYSIRILVERDVKEMVSVYKNVFVTYPFPIFDEKYIMKTMAEETIYFGVFNNNQLVGISSCVIASAQDNVEMTDFAILPKYRGNSLARHLLKTMDLVMKEKGIKTAYTIARSISFPMNATFKRAGYEYRGTLWNNTQIAGEIESMNVWYKPL